MDRHKLTYIDLHPAPIANDKAPPLWAQVIGLIVTAVVLHVSLVVLLTF